MNKEIIKIIWNSALSVDEKIAITSEIEKLQTKIEKLKEELDKHDYDFCEYKGDKQKRAFADKKMVKLSQKLKRMLVNSVDLEAMNEVVNNINSGASAGIWN